MRAYSAENTLHKKQCPQCFRMYRHRYTMLKHLREACGKPAGFRCGDCDYTTKYKGNFKKHLKRLKHEPPKPTKVEPPEEFQEPYVIEHSLDFEPSSDIKPPIVPT